jgi:hypothetical protein
MSFPNRCATFVTLALIAASLSGVAGADDSMVHQLRNADAYLVAKGPQPSAEDQAKAREHFEREREASAAARESRAVEKPAAVITGDFTVVPNVSPGTSSNFSFLRFPNFNASTAATTSVRMIGDQTGRDYGTALVSSAPYSSPQLSVTDLFTSIGETLDPADTSLTFYLQNNQVLTGIQHVYYSTFSDFFENMSVCSFRDLSYIPMASGVVNVHTTTLFSRFPSVVRVHNQAGFATTIRLRIHDGPTGNQLGILQFNALPNSTYAFNSQQIEAAIGYIPTSADFHMNVFLDSDPTQVSRTVLSHTVTNFRVSGAVLNLTTICNIND